MVLGGFLVASGVFLVALGVFLVPSGGVFSGQDFGLVLFFPRPPSGGRNNTIFWLYARKSNYFCTSNLPFSISFFLFFSI